LVFQGLASLTAFTYNGMLVAYERNYSKSFASAVQSQKEREMEPAGQKSSRYRQGSMREIVEREPLVIPAGRLQSSVTYEKEM
jgi:hypothetical protein